MGLRHWVCAAVGFFSVSSLALADDQTTALGRIGAFDRAVSYAWEFSPSEMSLEAHPWNAHVGEAWIYTRVFTKSGKQYMFMRYVGDLSTTGVTLRTDGQDDHRVPRANGDVTRTVDSTAGLVFTSKDAGKPGDGKGFKIELSPTAVSWTESGIMDLHGSGSPLGRVGSGAFMPYIQKDGATGVDIYTGQYQPVTGTVFGEPVTGMFVIDHFIGMNKFHDSNLARNEVAWFKFANVFEDGSVEMAECFWETTPMHGCVVSDGNKVIAHSDEPQVKFAFDSEGRMTKETWTIGKRQWVMFPDKTGPTRGWTGDAPGAHHVVQLWGEAHRIGDKRKAVNAFSIIEYYENVLPASLIESGKPQKKL